MQTHNDGDGLGCERRGLISQGGAELTTYQVPAGRTPRFRAPKRRRHGTRRPMGRQWCGPEELREARCDYQVSTTPRTMVRIANSQLPNTTTKVYVLITFATQGTRCIPHSH